MIASSSSWVELRVSTVTSGAPGAQDVSVRCVTYRAVIGPGPRDAVRDHGDGGAAEPGARPMEAEMSAETAQRYTAQRYKESIASREGWRGGAQTVSEDGK